MPSDPFYWSSPWRRFRASILKARPICEVPGCGRASLHVDHRIARRAGGADLDPANACALCHAHHSEKTARSDGGFGNARRPGAPLAARGADANGNPVDPNHRWASKP